MFGNKAMQSKEDIARTVRQRMELYGRGRPVQTREIKAFIKKTLARTLPHYTYSKDQDCFSRPFEQGHAFVGAICTPRMRTLSLSFGICHEQIERIKTVLMGAPPSGVIRSTLWFNTYNIGPRSWYWKYPTDLTWPVSGEDGLKLAASDLVDFVTTGLPPYLERHQDPAEIRSTLLSPRPPAFPLDREATILSIDVLLEQPQWLQGDYAILMEHARKLAAKNAEELPPQWTAARNTSKQRIEDIEMFYQKASDLIAKGSAGIQP